MIFPLALAMMIAGTPEHRHVALVVGSNRGFAGETPLEYAVQDANRLASALRDVSTNNVIVLEEPNESDLDRSLAEVRERIARDTEAHWILSFYYAGHADEASLHLGAQRYAVERISARLQETDADVILAVVDGCRGSEGLVERGLARVKDESITVAALEPPSGVVWIRSTSNGEAAHESELLRGGVFTHFWVSAIRGGADHNRDGVVTLSEAFEYTSALTHGYVAAAGPALVQSPTFDVRLRGSRDLPLAITERSPSTIVLPADAGGHYVVRSLPSGATIAVIEAQVEAPVRVAVPEGRFDVLRRRSGDLARAEIQLPWGGTRTLSADDFSPIPWSATARRGALPNAPMELWAGVSGGIAWEPALPIAWQRAQLDFGLRLAPPSHSLMFRSFIGWQGLSFEADRGVSRIRSDALQIGLGACYVRDFHLLTLALGPRAIFEWTKQSAERSSFGGAPRTESRRSIRGAGALASEVRIPLSGVWWWSASLLGGVWIQKGAKGNREAAPFFEISSGPALAW